MVISLEKDFMFLFMNRFKEQKTNAMAQTVRTEREDLAYYSLIEASTKIIQKAFSEFL